MRLFQGFVLRADDGGGLIGPADRQASQDEGSGPALLMWLAVPHVVAAAMIVHGDVAIGVVQSRHRQARRSAWTHVEFLWWGRRTFHAIMVALQKIERPAAFLG
jgi:hypothetical protein